MRANGTDSFTTSRTLSHGISLWMSETIHPVCLPFLLSPFRIHEDTFSSILHWQPEFLSSDAPNTIANLLCKPEIAIQPNGDLGGSTVGMRKWELGNLPRWGNAPNLVAIRKPEGAIGSGRDSVRAAVSAGEGKL